LTDLQGHRSLHPALLPLVSRSRHGPGRLAAGTLRDPCDSGELPVTGRPADVSQPARSTCRRLARRARPALFEETGEIPDGSLPGRGASGTSGPETPETPEEDRHGPQGRPHALDQASNLRRDGRIWTGDPLTPEWRSRRLRCTRTVSRPQTIGGHLRVVRPQACRAAPKWPPAGASSRG